MKITDKDNIYYGAFISWQNYWHAWGNIQSYSLLQVYKLTKDKELLNSALLEINNFYKYLVDTNFLNEFEVENENGNVSLVSKKQFSQIPIFFCTIHQLTRLTGYVGAIVNQLSWFSV